MKRKVLCLIALILISVFPAFSDSFTLSTGISNVTQMSGFGWGLFPVGTTFKYSTGFHPFKSLTHGANFTIEFNFGMGDVDLTDFSSWYDYSTGRPWWYEGGPEEKDVINGRYFRLYSQFDLSLEQSFGINPVQQSGALMTVGVKWVSRYSSASESLSLTADGPSGAIFTKPPFTTGESLAAYPWLYGDRKVWNNSIILSSTWYFRRSTTNTENYDGMDMSIAFEMGPSWLGNSVFPDAVTSDFYKLSWSMTEYLTLFVVEQDNGWNWINAMLGHSNTLGYTFGDVIPEHRLQTDRLRGYFTDSVWIKITGPQFIATDCYPYFQISLNNNLAFGGVQNDVTGKIHGVELRSSVNFEVHLRLFGFIHVNYTFGYDFINGFSPEAPSWRQSGQLGFYVSL